MKLLYNNYMIKRYQIIPHNINSSCNKNIINMFPIISVYQVFIFVSLLSFASGIFHPVICNFNVKLKQVLHNEGFHRNITYGIVFDSEDEEKWVYSDCIVGLEQPLPVGVYANPDELNDLRRINKLNAIPKNKINIELPAEQSTPSSVYVISKMRQSQVHLWLPVHARYHSAVSGGGMARNEISPPKLYLRCPDERLAACDKFVSPAVTFLCNGSSREKCSWKEIPYTMMTDTLVWEVPVGNLDHYYPVAIGTALVIMVGSLYLLNTLHEYNINRKKKQY